MASISDIVNVTVSTLTAAVKQEGFGIPLIADYHTRFSERVRLYSDLDGMVDDGFAVTDSAYVAAAQAFAQDPQPDQVAIGRRALNPTIRIDLYPTAVNSKLYEVEVTLPNGTVTTASYTSDGTATVAEITAGLTSAIDALTGMAASDQSTFIRVTADSATSFFAIKVKDKALLRADHSHADPGIATDLAAIKLENDSWYGLTLTTQGGAEIDAASSWAESNKKLMLQASADGDILTGVTDDIASTVKAANRNRTALIFSSDPSEHAGAAWLGKGFPLDPGGITFANMQLSSVTAEPLTSTQIANLTSKNCNFFTTYGDKSLTRNGKVASGEFVDIIRDRDAYESDLQSSVLQAMLSVPKVPFTDQGIAILEAAVRAATQRFIANGFLVEGSDAYDVPLASEVSANDRANRTLGSTPIKVSARVAGAIHVAEVRATITV